MTTQTNEPFRVSEGSSARLSFKLLDQDDVAVGSGELLALTLTLYDCLTHIIINGRDEIDVLNNNDVTVGLDGVVVWGMLSDDNPIIGNPGADGVEEHRAKFTWVFDDSKAGTREFRIVVANLMGT